MTSKERMILQFQHKETDPGSVGDPCINSRRRPRSWAGRLTQEWEDGC